MKTKKRKYVVEARVLPRLAPGWYTLSKDVENPLPDRRSTGLMNRPTWKAGSKVKVRHGQVPDGMGIPPSCFGMIEFSDGTQIHYSQHAPDPGLRHGNDLLFVLEKSPMSVGLVLKDGGYPARYLIALAVEKGLLTIDGIKDLIAEIEEMSEEQSSAFDKKYEV